MVTAELSTRRRTLVAHCAAAKPHLAIRISVLVVSLHDASRHNPDPRYLRGLLEQASLSQRQEARMYSSIILNYGSVIIIADP